MILAIECIVMCGLLFLMCFLGTGNDDKNLRSFSSYPKELQGLLKDNDLYKDKIKVSHPLTVFFSNFLMFLVIFFLLGIPYRSNEFISNLVALFILGFVMNLFDLLIIDICWFRNTKRTRFTAYPDKELYKGVREHVFSFLRGLLMYLIVALVDGALLMLF